MKNGTDTYRVEVTRKPVRHARMRVMPDGTIRITAPEGFDTSAFLAEKKDWIAARQEELNQLAMPFRTAADQMLLCGTGYSVSKGNHCQIDHCNKLITAPDHSALRQHLTNNFRTLLTESISDRAEKMGVSFGRCAIRMQKTRWGSCSSAGNLNFNLKLYALPTHLRNYVVVHELTHLNVMNHSPAFWSEVATQYPAYLDAEQDLRRYWVAIEQNHWWKALQKQTGRER